MAKKETFKSWLESGSYITCFMFILVMLNMNSCSSARSSYLKDTILDYHTRGFLSSNLFQVHCDTRLIGEDKTDDAKRSKTKLRSDLVNHCRNQAVQKLAEYKIEYSVYIEEKLNAFKNQAEGSNNSGYTEDINRTNFIYHWQPEQLQALLLNYQDLLPGTIVFESSSIDYISGVYRIEHQDLIEVIQNRPLPFKYELNLENSTQFQLSSR